MIPRSNEQKTIGGTRKDGTPAARTLSSMSVPKFTGYGTPPSKVPASQASSSVCASTSAPHFKYQRNWRIVLMLAIWTKIIANVATDSSPVSTVGAGSSAHFVMALE